ncbi:hypothetical protein MMC29_000511 [Sticta canariensis]|nr:hypothetical protein [Sticta canariensis]
MSGGQTLSSTSTPAQSLCDPGASSASALFNRARFMLRAVKYSAFTRTAAELYCDLAATVAFVPFDRGALYRRRFNAGFYIYCRALRAFYPW